jgi:hypothetical protein
MFLEFWYDVSVKLDMAISAVFICRQVTTNNLIQEEV